MAFIRWFLGKIILTLDAIFSPRAPDRPKAQQQALDESAKLFAIYEYRACPFCVKVRRFLKGAGLQLELRDAKAEPFRSELLKGGGKLQVPCLRIEKSDGSVQWMYESGDIINHLKNTLAV